MKTYIDCLPCLVRQVLNTGRMATDNPEKLWQIMRRSLEKLKDVSTEQPPPYTTRQIYMIIRELTGCDDPYKGIKKEFNQMALELLPGLQQLVKESADSFETAVRLAIAGNIIDFGPLGGIDKSTVTDTIKECLELDLPRGSINRLRSAVGRASKILYLADNAGEIVFDRLLLLEMPREKIIFAVRGGPAINDATLEDAVAAGVTDLVKVIDNGCDAPGTILELCSAGFRQVFDEADLIIAKGQGNYETLSHLAGKNIFFLLKIKCPVVAATTGCKVGDIVIILP